MAGALGAGRRRSGGGGGARAAWPVAAAIGGCRTQWRPRCTACASRGAAGGARKAEGRTCQRFGGPLLDRIYERKITTAGWLVTPECRRTALPSQRSRRCAVAPPPAHGLPHHPRHPRQGAYQCCWCPSKQDLLLTLQACPPPSVSSTSMAGSGKQVALLLPPLGRAAAMRLRLVADARPAVELAAAAGRKGQQFQLITCQKCMCSACWWPGGRWAGRVLPFDASCNCSYATPSRRTSDASQSATGSSGATACQASAVQSADRGGCAVRPKRLHAATPDARCRRGIAGCAPGQGGAELSTVHQFVGLLICNARHESGLGRQACKGKWSS